MEEWWLLRLGKATGMGTERGQLMGAGVQLDRRNDF
jgi:hypothetical protein